MSVTSDNDACSIRVTTVFDIINQRVYCPSGKTASLEETGSLLNAALGIQQP